MSAPSEVMKALFVELAGVLDRHVAPLFKPGTELALIALTPGEGEKDVLITSSQDLDALIALLERSKKGEMIQ